MSRSLPQPVWPEADHAAWAAAFADGRLIRLGTTAFDTCP